MTRATFRTNFFVAIPLLALTACSSGRGEAPEAVQKIEFGPEEKRVAQALSVSNNQAVMNAETPYARALLCKSGIDVLADRFGEARGLSSEQKSGMEQARVYFDEQLQLLATREGKSGADLAADLKAVTEDGAISGESAQIVVACLRRLQSAG